MLYYFILTQRSKNLWISCSESSCHEHKRLSPGSQKSLESKEKVQLQQPPFTFLSVRKQINSPKSFVEIPTFVRGFDFTGESFQRSLVSSRIVNAWKPREMWLEEGEAGVGWGRKKKSFPQDLNTQTETKEAVRCHHHPCRSSASFPRQGRSSSEQLPCICRCRITSNTPWHNTANIPLAAIPLQAWELRAELLLTPLQDLEGISTWL